MSSFRKGRPDGGVERYRVGNDGRTILADGKDGKEYIVSHNRDGSRKETGERVERQVKALNDKILQDKKSGIRRD